jgi:hypothetical protein
MVPLQDRETGSFQRKPIGAALADRDRAVAIEHLDLYPDI